MITRRLLVLVLAGWTAACGEVEANVDDRVFQAGIAAQALPPPAVDTAFAALVERLSEPGGYFDTDNLISNEDSYLHVLGTLRQLGVSGGAYIGVGPDQNFSYMAQIRPEVAFIIDIRRDNLLQHLWLKSMFTLSPTRVEFLSLMFGREAPSEPVEWSDASLEALLQHVETAGPSATALEELRTSVLERAVGFGIELSEQDTETLAFIHNRFIQGGPGIQFNTHGRAPNPYYPSYRDLMLAEDLTGRRGHYLAREEDYAFLRGMQLEHRAVPVVGNLAGDHALAAIGREIEARGLTVSALYTSNVEFYLMGDRSFDRFARTASELPRNDDTVLIRSFFRRWHPQSVPGFLSTQLLQRMTSFTTEFEAGRLRSYQAVVTLGSLDLRTGEVIR